VSDGVSVRCHGKELAQIECFQPSSEFCGTLALVFSGGERVLLAPHGAEQPEIAHDASYIWFRDPAIRSDLWNVYDPQSGVMQQQDTYTVSRLHRAEPPPIPLGKGAKP
jgi:hypothetical protein